VICADENEKLTSLPYFVSEIATVNSIKFTSCAQVPNHESIKKFSYYQLGYLMEKLGSKYDIAEDDWKKMDKLEEYINKHTEYNIGNKMWLCLEKYSTVNLACGGDSKTALDMGVSAKLLPSMIVSLSGKMSKEEKSFYEVLDDVFGEDNADRCKALVKSLGSDLA
jgi:hypothetical protein